MKRVTSFFVIAAVSALSLVAAGKLKLEDLPKPVQNTVKEQTQSATLAGLSKEVEKGKTMYEVETKVNGKSRDLLVDASGAIVEVEQETDLATIPAAAKAAIEKLAAGGKIGKVESVTQGTVISYETTITTPAGKKHEVAVNADGTPHKG